MFAYLGRRASGAGQWDLIVAGAALLFALVYVLLDLNELYALRTNQNTGLYLQSLANFVHSGSTFNTADYKPHLFVHDQWLVLGLAPLVALWPRPETLILAQVLALALSGVLLYRFACACGLAARAAAFLACAYLVSPSVQGYAYKGFVPEHFLPALAFALALAARRRNLVWVLVCAQLILGIKEDQAWFLMWFGLAGAIAYDRRMGLGVAILALANAAAYYGFELAHGLAPEAPRYAPYDGHVLQQVAFLLEILVPFAFAPLLLRARVFLALPLLVELFFAQRAYPMYQTGYYYTEALVTLIAIASAVALVRRPALAAYALAGSCVMALFFNTTALHFGRGLFSPDPQYRAAWSWARDGGVVSFPCEDEGAWVVAAGNVNARLGPCPLRLRRLRPAWRDAPLASRAPWTAGRP